ncbi:MAG TPA: SRPBCC family protein [Methylophilaceae bacterium]|jgi:carbon monoxide dehydrogenase subunit G
MRKLLAITALFVPLLAFAHGPTPQKVEQTITINAAPAKVWALLKDFGNWQTWDPAIASTSKLETKDDGVYRTITLKSGGTNYEKLRSADDKEMKLKYEAEDNSVIAASDYVGTITVTAGPAAGQTTVSWIGHFYRKYMLNPPIPAGQDDETADKAVGDLVTTGLAGLKAAAEKK